MSVTKAVEAARIVVIIIAHGDLFIKLQFAKVLNFDSNANTSLRFFSDLRKMISLPPLWKRILTKQLSGYWKLPFG